MAVAAERHGVATLPGLAARATNVLVVTMTFAETAVLATSGGEATQLAVLVHRVDDPVDARVATNSLVGGVNHDDLKKLVRGVLTNPVRVKNTQVAARFASAFLGQGALTALPFQLVHTLIGGLTVGGCNCMIDRWLA